MNTNLDHNNISFNSFTNELTIDGVRICLETLEFLVRPNPEVLYSFSRAENIVTITQHTGISHKTTEVLA